MELNNIHQAWLNKHKISDNVIADFKIFTSDQGDIAFPVMDIKGDVIFNKYRRSPEKPDSGPKYTYDKGGKVTLYGYHLAKDHDRVLITEGEKDCLVAWSHNIPAVTSTGGALSFQNEWKELLKDKEIIICFDNDFAGGQGMAKVARLFGLENVKIMFLPNGVKDIADFVETGKDLHKLMRTAKTITSVVDDMSDRKSWELNCFFHYAWLDEEKKKETQYQKGKKIINKNITDDLLLAKEYPIPQIIDIDMKGKAICPFHNEKTPSLHYYKETNTTYCFGQCGKRYDAIDIYMNKFGCDFKTAVEEMSSFLKRS